MRRIITLSMAFLLSITATFAKSHPGHPKPTDDPTLVKGAAFKDRFLPMPKGKISSENWGAKCVQPRNVENGIESQDFSYWGGNIVVGDDGKYHMIVCRWPQDIANGNKTKSGHGMWWNSDVVHAVCDKPEGPYKVVGSIGKGHNPEVYRLKDGSYVVGVMGNKAYTAPTIDGPWKQIVAPPLKGLTSDKRDENCTYLIEDDGTVFMVNKEGYSFRSDGKVESFTQIDIPKLYHRYDGSHEEDPVIWKDEICYNILINECLGRKAYHLTSNNGAEWFYEEGIAYTPDVVYNHTGQQEKWWKMERSKVLLDKWGRVTHVNFAAIDTLKSCDLANDNHSSKNIVIPLRIARRMEIVSPKKVGEKSSEITIKLLAEDGFDPYKEIDAKTLRLGGSILVNHGKGLEVSKVKKCKEGVLITFKGKKSGLTAKDYKIKLLGALKNGEPLWAYARL